MNEISKENLDLFKHLSDERFQEIQSLFKLESFEKGDFIIQENQLVNKIYLVRSGLVKLFFLNDKGNEFILSFAFENWWETDFAAFFSQEKSQLNLQCLEKVEVFSVVYEDYLKLVNDYQMANYFLDKSIRGHIANQNRILTLLSNSPKEKYEQFLKIYPALVQRLSKSVLALYLGVSRETLSRIYK